MKWSSHPGASAGTKASSRATPERAIAALKQSSWRCVAAVPLDLTGPLTTTRSRALGRGRARYAGDGADAVHVGIEGAEDVALARRFAHAADLARLQRPRAELGHLLVEPSDIEHRPVFAVADAVEADFDLALHDIRDHRHDLCRDLLAADLATREADGCLLEARGYGKPPDVAGADLLCAILHRPPPRMRIYCLVIPGRLVRVGPGIYEHRPKPLIFKACVHGFRARERSPRPGTTKFC